MSSISDSPSGAIVAPIACERWLTIGVATDIMLTAHISRLHPTLLPLEDADALLLSEPSLHALLLLFSQRMRALFRHTLQEQRHLSWRELMKS